MKVVVPKVSGFCGGVERAIKLAYNAAEMVQGDLYMDGELVHNKEVMQEIVSKKGIKILGDLPKNAKFNRDDCVVIRAHGVSQARRSELQKAFHHVFDGTCPHVAKTASTIQKALNDGFAVVIIGDKQHPEIIALSGDEHANRCFVVNNEDEITKLPKDLEKVFVVAQSTINVEFFNNLSRKIQEIYGVVVVKDTVCQSSKNRQRAVLEVKNAGAEAVVVVGGKHSNNTKTLADIASNIGLPVFHIETVRDLGDIDFSRFSTIGVVAGASTSEQAVQAVIVALEQI